MDISGRDNVLAALTSPDLAVTPPAPPAPTPSTLAWLRAGVPRFSRGPEHPARRGYAQDALDRVDPAALRATARRLAQQALAGDPSAAVAQEVPVRALADELGLPAVSVADVAAVAKVYLGGAGDPAEILAADSAVARLLAAVGGGSDDRTAALVGVLVQSYQATATLITNAASLHSGLSSAEVVATTLRVDPPTPPARRMATVDTRIGEVSVAAGETVLVAIGAAGYPFGAGPHACPGAAHATAIAEGVLDAVRAAAPPTPPRS
jgi:hypothetical protein